MAGHDHPEDAMKQLLTLPARFFAAEDEENVPTGELRPVDGTPMDFRTPKPIGQDIHADYDAINLQHGYDHNFEVFCSPCAILRDPGSGRTMAVHTDCPGIQLYAGNYLNDHGKDGVYYCKRSGVALETQFYPDSVNHPEWAQPFVKAGQPYHSTTKYVFSW
jgi:aldose 1-epimerase